MKSPAGIALGSFLLLTALLFSPALIRRDQVLGDPRHNDAIRAFIPFHAYCQRALRGGEWPLWCPNISGGMPAAMFGQSGLFYPLNWPTLFIPSPDAMDIQRALHFLIALIATWWICRRLGLGSAGATAAALAWALSGAMMGRLNEGHISIFQALSWFPMAWGGLVLVVSSSRPTRAHWLAAVGGFATMGLISAPQLWLLALLIGAMTALLAILILKGYSAASEEACPGSAGVPARNGDSSAKSNKSIAPAGKDDSLAKSNEKIALAGEDARAPSASSLRSRAKTVLIKTSIIFSLAIGLAAAEWLPVAAASRETARAQLEPEFEDWELDFPLKQLASIPLPYFFDAQSNEHRASIGIIALALAACAFIFPISPSRKSLARLAAALGFVALWMALGTKGGFYPAVKFLFPPLSLAAPAAYRFLFMVSWPLCLCAGLGLDAVLARFAAAQRSHARMILIALGLLLFDLVIFERSRFALCPVKPEIPFPNEIAQALAREKQGGRVLNTIPEFLNLSLIYGFEDVNGYGVTMPADFARVGAWIAGRQPRSEHWAHFNDPSPPFCYWNAVRYLIAYAKANPDPGRWAPVWAGEAVGLWRLKEDWPRAQLYERYRTVTRAQAEALFHPVSPELLQTLAIEDLPANFDFSKTAIARNTPAQKDAATAPATVSAIPAISMSATTVNHREWKIEGLQKPCWALIHENWSRGWQARVDGVPARVWRAQCGLCAIALPSDARHIEMTYHPFSFYAGLAISTVFILAALPIAWRIAGRYA